MPTFTLEVVETGMTTGTDVVVLEYRDDLTTNLSMLGLYVCVTIVTLKDLCRLPICYMRLHEMFFNCRPIRILRVLDYHSA